MQRLNTSALTDQTLDLIDQTDLRGAKNFSVGQDQ
jgi:hypothetical protein